MIDFTVLKLLQILCGIYFFKVFLEVLHIDCFLIAGNIGLYTNKHTLKAKATKLSCRITANTIFVEASVHV